MFINSTQIPKQVKKSLRNIRKIRVMMNTENGVEVLKRDLTIMELI
jgi:hypothetical protein